MDNRSRKFRANQELHNKQPRDLNTPQPIYHRIFYTLCVSLKLPLGGAESGWWLSIGVAENIALSRIELGHRGDVRWRTREARSEIFAKFLTMYACTGGFGSQDPTYMWISHLVQITCIDSTMSNHMWWLRLQEILHSVSLASRTSWS